MNKQIEEMAEAIFQNCHCGLFFSEAEKIADFVINKQGYRKSTDVASEIFEAIEKLFRQRFSDEVDGEYRINAQEFAELKKKYESEGADDFPNCKISGCEAARKDCHIGCPYGKENTDDSGTKI